MKLFCYSVSLTTKVNTIAFSSVEPNEKGTNSEAVINHIVFETKNEDEAKKYFPGKWFEVSIFENDK